jgi:hypothetical protein
MNEIIANKQANESNECYFGLGGTNQNHSPPTGFSYQRVKLRRMPFMRNIGSTSIANGSVGNHAFVADTALNARVTIANRTSAGSVRVTVLASTTIQWGFSFQIQGVVR